MNDGLFSGCLIVHWGGTILTSFADGIKDVNWGQNNATKILAPTFKINSCRKESKSVEIK